MKYNHTLFNKLIIWTKAQLIVFTQEECSLAKFKAYELQIKLLLKKR